MKKWPSIKTLVIFAVIGVLLGGGIGFLNYYIYGLKVLEAHMMAVYSRSQGYPVMGSLPIYPFYSFLILPCLIGVVGLPILVTVIQRLRYWWKIERIEKSQTQPLLQA